MKNNYPFDPFLKHHFTIAFGFGLWIFVFLFFTEPLDIQVFTTVEKLKYLPLYSAAGTVVYLLATPIQQYLYRQNQKQWFLKDELLFFIILFFIGLVILRIVFLLIIDNYTLGRFILDFYLPSLFTLLPLILISRWAFGRYFEKQIEASKIEIKGAGNYENLRLFFNDIVCIQSADNYVEITYLEQNTIKNALIRTKISSIKNDFSALLQTHRSYVINPFHFKQWQVKNGKTILVLTNDINIPVSKTHLEEVKLRLHSIS